MKVWENRTFSVPELRKILGLKKTESYWLVHKNYFETIIVAGRMRVVSESFMEWYDWQDHYKIIGGPKPGKEIRKEYYTSEELGELLGIQSHVASNMARYHDLDLIIDNHKMRVKKESFDNWVTKQDHYRLKKQRLVDEKLREKSLSIPDIGRVLGITRDEAYELVHNPDRNRHMEMIKVAGQKRILLDSFRKWYCDQAEYHFNDDNEFFGIELRRATGDGLFNIKDVATITNIPTDRIYRMIYTGKIKATVIDGEKMVYLKDIEYIEKEVTHGVNSRKK